MKKNNIITRQTLVAVLSSTVLAGVVFFLLFSVLPFKKNDYKTQTIAPQLVQQQLLASGFVRSQNEADLHFQTGGKLVYLGYKEGQKVASGQTIASLDSYAIQKQMQASLNTYRQTRDTFDQTNDNAQTNVLDGQQKNVVDASHAGVGTSNEQDIIDRAITRIVDQNQANLDNSIIQVQLNQYAISLASITSPISGTITHEDVTNPYINVSTLTTFSVADFDALVFKASVDEDQIDFIQSGAHGAVQLSGSDKKMDGTVLKIYPNKTILANGESVYQVDIAVDNLKGDSLYNRSGVVLIDSKFNADVLLIPSWVVLSNKYVLVLDHDKIVKKTITVGDHIGNSVEVLGGLTNEDKIITDPKSIIEDHYKIL